MKTLDQRRATHAYEAVKAVVKAHVKVQGDKKVPDSDAKKFGIHARKLPTRIMASGLGQSLAFLIAKNYCPDLVFALNQWVLHQADFKPREPSTKADELLQEIMKQDGDFLRRKTGEALAYLQWLVRFAEAEDLTKDTDISE